jgi:hypothetical protein
MSNTDFLFPTQAPSRALARAWRRRVPEHSHASTAQVNAILRGVALHEAAHAVTHDRFGHVLRLATIRAGGNSAGRVEYNVDASTHPENRARAALAGPIADMIRLLIHGFPAAELKLSDDDGDVERALRVGGYACKHINDLIAETTTFVSQPRVWGAIVIVADVLLKRGLIEGVGLHALIKEARSQATQRISFSQEKLLSAARNELLNLDDSSYVPALYSTLTRHQASVGVSSEKQCESVRVARSATRVRHAPAPAARVDATMASHRGRLSGHR